MKINPKETLRICGDATPGPWHRVFTDDTNYMSAVYVGTTDRGDRHDNKTGFDGSRDAEIIAATLHQMNPGIDHASGKWDENADMIVHAREALPEYAAWVTDVCQNLQGILCERDDGAPTERNLKLAELLARVKCE